jgi:membrane protein
MLSKFINFVKTDIWRIRLKDYPPSKSFFINQLRIIVLSIRGFYENKCQFRASALTFFTLLSIVPVIAMMFGIAKGFGLEKRVESQLLAKMQGQEEVAQRIITFSNSLLENTSGGLIAGIGVAILFYTIIKLLSSIEDAFNYTWGVKTPRSFGRRFSDYLSIMLVCPILLAISGSATILISTQIKNIIENLPILKGISTLVLVGLRLLPYVSLWVIFTFIFMFMPNTKVRFRSALLAGIVTGTIFQIAQWLYVNLQIGAASYGAIYGSFAAIPLFLVWMQASWVVVLFGAELSFAHQNVDTYEFEPDCLNISLSYKKLLSLLVAHLLVKDFCEAKEAPNDAEISQRLDMPIRLVREILFELEGAGLISQVNLPGKTAAYQPKQDVNNFTIKFVLDALESKGNDSVPVAHSKELDKLSHHIKDLSALLEKSPANVLLKDI